MKWTLDELGEYADEHWGGEFRVLQIAKGARERTVQIRGVDTPENYREEDENWVVGFGECTESSWGKTAEEAIERALTQAEKTFVITKHDEEAKTVTVEQTKRFYTCKHPGCAGLHIAPGWECK